MADITLYVNGTDNAGSHYFTSLAAALAHAASDHPDFTAGTGFDGILHVEISITTAETPAVTVSGFTTDSTHYLNIYTTAAARHGGEWSTSKYRLVGTPSGGRGMLDLGNGSPLYATLTGLQSSVTLPQDATNYHCYNTNNAGVFTFDSCLARLDNSAGADTKGVAFSIVHGGAGNTTLRNCAAMAVASDPVGSNSKGAQEYLQAGSTLTILNCTFKNFAVGIEQLQATVTAQNVGLANCTSATSGTVGQTTCSSTTPTFADGQEFHLASTDTTWHDQGTDLSGTFTTDIDGETRVTWDIGCDEYVAAATGQFARPASDVADGNWLNQVGSGTNLYASIDEETASDTDYVVSGATPTDDTMTVGLGSLSVPGDGTVTMRIRAKYL
jgi:hypothetical protein